MAPLRDATSTPRTIQADPPTAGLRPGGSARSRWFANLSLPARLFLLVVASVVPLVGMGLVREYFDYRSEREAVYEGLKTIARGTAVAVERELQLRVSSLETLAMSPALSQDNLIQFDTQAAAFLDRLPPGTVAGVTTADGQVQRLYGFPVSPPDPLPRRSARGGGDQVFGTRQPVITDLHVGSVSGKLGFTVDVPVIRGGVVVYDLFIRLLPEILEDLLVRQRIPPRAVMTIVDTSGTVVARFPNGSRFAGSPIVPELWSAIQANPEGIVQVRTLEGVPAVASYTHVAPFGWAVVVGAPEEVIFAPLRVAIIHVAEAGSVGLVAALLLALLAARGIMHPIEQLGRLAERDDWSDLSRPTTTGLPETDVVARALLSAAAARQAAARELAESEQRFRALFEKSPNGTILLDPETARVIDCNEVAASIVGYSVEEFRTCSILDFALQTTPQQIQEMCRLVADGASRQYETRVLGRQGPRDLLIAVAPVQVSGRTLMLINQSDITDLRHAQDGLRINEERLELAREGANLGIWDWDIANGTLSWSDHQWHLHGLEREPTGPSPEVWRRTVHPSDLRRAQDELVSALKIPGRPYSTEYSVVMPDGSLRRLLGRGQSIRGADGRTVRMVGINMDVTARYEAEMARDRLIWMLETERSRLSDIIEALPIGVGIVDATGRVILGNSVMKRLMGPIIPSMSDSNQGEWIAEDLQQQRLPPDDFPIRRALRRGETTLPGQDFRFRDTGGAETWFRVGSVPLRWDDGKVQEALGIFLDIGAEKRLLDVQQQITARLEQRVSEEVAAREAAQKRAAHAERMHALGQIAGGIAHDFNNVLQAVLGGAALIESRPANADRVLRNARMVLDAATRGAAITSRLLAFSRRGDLRAEPVDASALLIDMADVLTHTLGSSVLCTVDAPPGLPPLLADRGQLETVLVNLATNARDAMPSGGTLTLSAASETVSAGLPHDSGLEAGGYVRITVSDTGVGMDRAVLARVTEPFFTTKEPGKGTGLGLAMAKGFVEQSGGSLVIDSKVGFGTRISLWLPEATGVTEPMRALPAEARLGHDIRRVLLVDDDVIVREVLTESLEDAGYTVHSADSGAMAMSWLNAGEPVDIIVSDLTMPTMDGITLIRAAQQQRPNLPAVLVTGYAGDGAALAVGGAISGRFSLLRKPVSGAQLADRINALLADRKQPSKV